MKKLFLYSTIILVLVLWPLQHFGGLNYLKAALLSYVPSLFIVFFSYGSIRWAFTKSTKIFYSTLYVGMVIRFVVFILTLFFIYKFTDLPVIAFVITFMMFYIVFQIQELKLVVSELNQKRDQAV